MYHGLFLVFIHLELLPGTKAQERTFPSAEPFSCRQCLPSTFHHSTLPSTLYSPAIHHPPEYPTALTHTSTQASFLSSTLPSIPPFRTLPKHSTQPPRSTNFNRTLSPRFSQKMCVFCANQSVPIFSSSSSPGAAAAGRKSKAQTSLAITRRISCHANFEPMQEWRPTRKGS